MKSLQRGALLASAMLAASGALAQSAWPALQITIVVGFSAGGDTPEELAAYIRAETAKWAPVVKASGARAD